MNGAKKTFNWIWKHPTETALFGLAATAFYKATRLSEENDFVPLTYVTNFAVAFGTQQIFAKTTGLSHPTLPALFSFGTTFLNQVNAQVNNTFFTVIGGNNADLGQGLTNTSDGGWVVTGATNSFGAGGYDILLTKFGSNGTFLWAKTIGMTFADTGQGIQETNNTDLVVAGQTYDSGGYDNIWIGKFSSNGNTLWTKKLGGNGYVNEAAFGLIKNDNEELIIAGIATNTGPGGQDAFLAKLSTNGTLLWAYTLGGSNNDYFNAIQVTRDTGLIAVGQTDSFGGAGTDVMLSKFNVNGTLQWARTLDGGSNDAGLAVQETYDGGFVVTGYVSTNFGAGYHENVLLAKFSSNGTFLWSQALGGNNTASALFGLVETADNGLVTVGQILGFSENPAALVTKFWGNGTLAWAKALGGINGDTIYAIHEATDGRFVLAGSTASFGAGNGDVLFVELDFNGNLASNCSVAISPFSTNVFPIVTNISPTVNVWNPNVTDWNPTVNSFSPSLQFPCLPPVSSLFTVAGGVATDEAYAIQNTTDGGFIVTGLTSSYYGAGSNSLLLMKWSSNGTLTWTETLGSNNSTQGIAVQAITDGSIIVAGFTNNFGAGSNDALIAKLSSTGTVLWAETFGGAFDEAAKDILQTADGGLVLVGYANTPRGGNYDILISKWWGNGTLTWTNTLGLGGASQNQGAAVTELSDGSLAVIGFTGGAVITSFDAFLARLSSNGTLLWARSFGGNSTEFGNALQQTSDGGIVAVGSTESYGGSDTLFTKWWNNGTLVWAKLLQAGSNSLGLKVQQTADGGLIVGGTGLFAKFFNNGTLQWATSLPASVFGMQQTANGFVLTGTTSSYGIGSNNVIFAKLDVNGSLPLNCVFTASNLNITDITNLLNVTTIIPTVTAWSPTVMNWNITANTVYPFITQPCSPISTPAPTPNPTTISTTSSSTSTNSGSSTTQPRASSSNGGNKIPIYAGAAAGAGVVLLGAGIGATLFFKRRKKPKPGPEDKTVQNIELAKMKPEPANSSTETTQFTPAMSPQYAKMSDVLNQQQQKQIGSSRPVSTSQPGQYYLPFTQLPPKQKPSIYTTFVARNVAEKYELIKKINKEQAKVLTEQTGLEVVFAKGAEETEVVLGKGQFGELRIAKKKENNESKEFICVKEITDEGAIEDSQLEAQLQTKLKGLNYIMPLLDSIPAEKAGHRVLYQFMPIAGFGNGEFLRKALKECQDAELKQQILAQVMYGLLTGFKGMHNRHVYHMDFKPANFVIDQWGDEFVIDFGCAIETEEKLINGVNGDTRYFAPERLEYHRSDKQFEPGKADAWALGVTLLELALGKYPFDSCSFEQRKEQWDGDYFLNKFKTIEEFKDPDEKGIWIIIRGLLRPDPKKRLSIQQALNMPVFTEVKLQFASKEEGKKQMGRLKEIAQDKVDIEKEKPVSKTEDKNYPSAHPQEQKKLQEYYRTPPSQRNDNQKEESNATQYQLSPDSKQETHEYMRLNNNGKMVLSNTQKLELAPHEYSNVPKEQQKKEQRQSTSSQPPLREYANVPKQQDTVTQNFFVAPQLTGQVSLPENKRAEKDEENDKSEQLESVYPEKTEFGNK